MFLVDPDIMTYYDTCHVPENFGLTDFRVKSFSHKMKLPAAAKQKSKVFALTTRSSNAGPVGFGHRAPVKSRRHRRKSQRVNLSRKGLVTLAL